MSKGALIFQGSTQKYSVSNFISFTGKFAQRPNTTQRKLIQPNISTSYPVTDIKVNVTDASFINDEIIEIHFENVDERLSRPLGKRTSSSPLLLLPFPSQAVQCPETVRSPCAILLHLSDYLRV